jgi:recombination protein RecT
MPEIEKSVSPAAEGNKAVAKKAATNIKEFLAAPQIQKRIEEMLGKRSTQFTTSIISMAGQDKMLADAEPRSLFNAALTAASLDLPINKNLGFAHIIPYKNNKAGIIEAQFQMGYKGFVQLAQRSSLFSRINAVPVYDGQLIEQNALSGNTYNWQGKKNDKIVGYVAAFNLLNGYTHELYMSIDEIKKHAGKYSQSFKYNSGPWKDNFDAMALKTVLKLLLSKWAPLSVEMQTAVQADQAVIKEEGHFNYVDGEVSEEELGDDIVEAITQATDNDELTLILNDLTVAQQKLATPYVTDRLAEIAATYKA